MHFRRCIDGGGKEVGKGQGRLSPANLMGGLQTAVTCAIESQQQSNFFFFEKSPERIQEMRIKVQGSFFRAHSLTLLDDGRPAPCYATPLCSLSLSLSLSLCQQFPSQGCVFAKIAASLPPSLPPFLPSSLASAGLQPFAVGRVVQGGRERR